VSDSLERLYLAVIAPRISDPAIVANCTGSRAARPRWQEAGRRAIEVVIDAVNGNYPAVPGERDRLDNSKFVLLFSTDWRRKVCGRGLARELQRASICRNAREAAEIGVKMSKATPQVAGDNCRAEGRSCASANYRFRFPQIPEWTNPR